MFTEAMEHALVSLFVLEWSLNVAAKGWAWLTVPGHILDTIMVWICGVGISWILMPILGEAASKGQLLQTLRALRCLRVLRMFLVMTRFKSMQSLLMGLLSSQNTLVSCCVILLGNLVLSAYLGIHWVGFSSEWEGSLTRDDAAWHFQHGIVRAMMLMSRFMFHDDAISNLEQIQQKQPYIWIFFIGFMALSAYVVLNLITGVIVHHAFEISQASKGEVALAIQKQKKRDMQDLKVIFEQLDGDGDGTVSMTEFITAFDFPKLQDKMVLLGFERDELLGLFRILDVDGEGEINIREFTDGMLKIRGTALTKDMRSTSLALRKAMKHLEDVRASRRHTSGHYAERIEKVRNSALERMDRVEAQIVILKDAVHRLQSCVHSKMGRAVGGPGLDQTSAETLSVA